MLSSSAPGSRWFCFQTSSILALRLPSEFNPLDCPAVFAHAARLTLLTFALGVLSGPVAISQTASISGSVTDSSTGLPLGDAIIYVENSAIGVSTDSSGSFALKGLAAGRYVIDVARVGYRRRTREVEVGSNVSVILNVPLVPRPVQLRETEVVTERSPETPRHGDVLFPVRGSDRYCLYGPETALPIGLLVTDSVHYMFSIEPALIDSEWFIRVWFLAYNNGDAEFDLDAGKAMRLGIRKPAATYNDIAPWFPNPDVGHVEDSVRSGIISRRIGHTIQVLGDQREAYVWAALEFDKKGTSSPYIRGQSGPWAGKLTPPEAPGGVNPYHLSEAYKRSTYCGTLKHYRISPRSGVHGFVYFPWPGLHWQSDGGGLAEALLSSYTITILTPSGIRHIDFVPR